MGAVSDPIAHLLTKIRNASRAKLRFIDIEHSKLKEDVARVLKEQGYVAHYLVKEENKKPTLRVFLKYGSGRSPVIHGLKRVSKPSLRRYVSHKEIPSVLGGMGVAIISTSKGVMVGSAAHEKKVGGELLAYAW